MDDKEQKTGETFNEMKKKKKIAKGRNNRSLIGNNVETFLMGRRSIVISFGKASIRRDKCPV